jgi:hypothetical protein
VTKSQLRLLIIRILEIKEYRNTVESNPLVLRWPSKFNLRSLRHLAGQLMSLRQQAKILGINAGHLIRMINGKRAWNTKIKARCESLVGKGFGNSNAQSVAGDSKNESVVRGGDTRLLGVKDSSGGAE